MYNINNTQIYIITPSKVSQLVLNPSIGDGSGCREIRCGGPGEGTQKTECINKLLILSFNLAAFGTVEKTQINAQESANVKSILI